VAQGSLRALDGRPVVLYVTFSPPPLEGNSGVESIVMTAPSLQLMGFLRRERHSKPDGAAGTARDDTESRGVVAPAATLSDLVTAVTVLDNDTWDLTVVDAAVPDRKGFMTLGDVITYADGMIRDLYADTAEAHTAELQYAIYPWAPGTEAAVILDVTGPPGDLVGRDTQGSDFEVRASSPEELVAVAGLQLPDPSVAMIRWVKSVISL
jgi:hypothetical protein